MVSPKALFHPPSKYTILLSTTPLGPKPVLFLPTTQSPQVSTVCCFLHQKHRNRRCLSAINQFTIIMTDTNVRDCFIGVPVSTGYKQFWRVKSSDIKPACNYQVTITWGISYQVVVVDDGAGCNDNVSRMEPFHCLYCKTLTDLFDQYCYSAPQGQRAQANFAVCTAYGKGAYPCTVLGVVVAFLLNISQLTPVFFIMFGFVCLLWPGWAGRSWRVYPQSKSTESPFAKSARSVVPNLLVTIWQQWLILYVGSCTTWPCQL